ncbi:MAG: DUF1304 domain-containing protein [Propionibacteriaceae bacterium]
MPTLDKILFVTGIVLAIFAALLHCFIFYLESLAWTSQRARAVFGMSLDEAKRTTDLAYNQGFYNLFLAIEVFVGAAFLVVGCKAVGLTLVFAGIASMLAAAIVLALKFADKRGAAFKQGLFPLLAIIFLAISLAL